MPQRTPSFGTPATPAASPLPVATSPIGACLATLEDALEVRQEAVLAVERLLAGPHTPAELARAHRRVEGLTAAAEALVRRLERLAPPVGRGGAS